MKHLTYFTAPDKEELESNALYDTTDYGEKNVLPSENQAYAFPAL